MRLSLAVGNARAPTHFVSIAELAKRLSVIPRAPRHYQDQDQDQGLIWSHRIAHNVRAFDLETVAIIESVVALRDVDLPIAAIRDILALQGEPNARADALRAALLDVQADKRRQIARIDGILEALAASMPIPATPRAEGASPARRPAGRQFLTPWRQEMPDDRP